MHLIGRDRGLRKQRLERHAIVALGIVWRDEALVAPEILHALPVDLVAIGRSDQQTMEGAWRRAAREGEREMLLWTVSALQLHEEIRRRARYAFQIVMHADAGA